MSQVEIAVQQLKEAMDEAEQYVDSTEKLADGIAVHRDFLQTSVAEIERIVTNINKKNKTETIDMPPEVREATVMIKRLSILLIAQQKKEKDEESEKREKFAAIQQSKETQIIVNKAPIPPLQIPPFSGNALQYKNFITIFDDTVHKNSALQPSQKLAYLLQYVTGDALNVIGKMPIADENYTIARDLLAENYGDESRNISTLYDRLRQLQKATDEPYSLRDLYNESESIIRVLQQSGQDVSTNAYLYDELLKKYPFSFLVDVIHHEEMTFENFRKEAGRVIKLRVRLAQRTDNIPAKYKALEQKPSPALSNAVTGQKAQIPPLIPGLTTAASTTERQTTRRSLRTSERPPPYCTFCTEQHFSDQCTKYVTIAQRKEALKEKCHRCFQKVHPQSPCLRDQPCYYCTKIDHHRALCPQKFAEKSRTVQLTTASQPETNRTQKPGKFITLLATIENPENGHTREIRICVDPASDTTVLSYKVAKEMGLQLRESTYDTPLGLGGTPLPATTEEDYRIHLFPLVGKPISVKTKLTSQIGPNLRAPDLDNFRSRFPKHKDTPIPPTGQGRAIDMLIGTDTMLQIVTLQKSIYVNENNQLLSTRLGYLLLQGPDDDTETEEERVTMLVHRESEIKRMWDLDLIGLKYAQDKESTMEERALNQFYRTIQFIKNRYQVTWPWRTFPPNLPNNFGLAWGRLKSLHKKLVANKELLIAYDGIIKEQLQLDVVEAVPDDQRKSANITHYIPHHAVVDFQKSTPVRIVYDASAKIKGFDSLNESILKGTRWTGDLVASILRFRTDDVAVSADVKRAFHQILIKPDERDVMRFLWVKDVNKPLTEENVQIYRFKRMAFGIIASPFLLFAVLQHHFAQNPSKTNAILSKEMYADNLLASLPPETDPVKFYEETRQSFGQMSMEMAKWATNCKRLRDYIPKELQVPEKQTTTLGLNWDVETDLMSIKTCKIEHLKKKPPTKRIALKILASLFDPLGYALPIAMTARIFLRKVWEMGYSWDKPLDEDLKKEWSQIQLAIEKSTNIPFPRKYMQREYSLRQDDVEVHTFVDASAEAYVAVTYLRIQGDGERPIAFVMARGRLTPKNTLTIPRLELLAAVAGARLTEYVVTNLHLQKQIKTTLWSDSRCVISWINTLKILPSVIHRQVQEIRNAEFSEVRYVPTSMNPVDIATRKTDLETFENSAWHTGPSWLQNTVNWPKTEESYEKEEKELDDRVIMLFETKVAQKLTEHLQPPFQLEIRKYSDLKTLLRLTAHCIWILNTILKKEFIKTSMKIDYAAAKKLWLRWDQREAFPALRKLSPGATVTFNSQKIFKDDEGILRTVPRLANAPLPENTKTPVLLVKKSHLTKLIILDTHQTNMHVGTAYTLAALRRNYTLPLGRREVFSTIRTYCNKCKRYNTRPFKSPPTPPLPSFRVTPTETPFKKVGIDIFGPLLVFSDETKQSTEKRWILIFTCLVVRAVHFEVLQKMDTNEIIEAVRRFIGRRGAPQMLLSDNAPQFKLLNGVLSDLWRTVVQSEQGAKYFAEKEIEWHFIPQYAPWMGGVYERIIQITKGAFKRTYGEKKLTASQLATVIIEIEAVLNNRPITYVDRDDNTPIITPNHFLRVQYPAVSVHLDEENNTNKAVVTATRKQIVLRWKEAEENLNKYWTLWTSHYLLALRESANIVGSKRPSLSTPKEGDVVLMVDPSQRRGFWRTAVIDKLMVGGDGQARSALIRLSGGNKMIRPIVKLAPFEISKSFAETDLPTALVPSAPEFFSWAEGGSGDQTESEAESIIQLRYSGYEEQI